MPHFVLTCGQTGPMIELYVGVSAPRLAFLKSQGITPPNLIRAKGLIDTGASITAIDQDIFTSLDLTPKRVAEIITPSTGTTPHKTYSYDASIYISMSSDPQVLPYVNPAIEVTAASIKHQGFDVLIGRDILADGLFIYDGRSNLMTLSF